MSKPLYQFKQTLTRAEALLDIYDDRSLQIVAGAAEYIGEKDVVRASAITAVAAMDHYFTSKFCDVLVRHLKSKEPSQELLNILEKSGLNTRVALELAVMKRPFRRIRTMVQNHLSLYTSHRAKAIDKLFASLNLKGLSGRAEKRLGRKNIIKRTDKLVSLRNEIVHTGHLTSRGKVKSIDENEVRTLILELSMFVGACDNLIDEFVASK